MKQANRAAGPFDDVSAPPPPRLLGGGTDTYIVGALVEKIVFGYLICVLMYL